MDGLDSGGQKRTAARLYKTLPFGIIWVEAFGIETLLDSVSVKENPFHFCRTGVDNEPHRCIFLCKNKENCVKPNIFNSFAAHL